MYVESCAIKRVLFKFVSLSRLNLCLLVNNYDNLSSGSLRISTFSFICASATFKYQKWLPLLAKHFFLPQRSYLGTPIIFLLVFFKVLAQKVLRSQRTLMGDTTLKFAILG